MMEMNAPAPPSPNPPSFAFQRRFAFNSLALASNVKLTGFHAAGVAKATTVYSPTTAAAASAALAPLPLLPL
jgi:hypothetical protein